MRNITVPGGTATLRDRPEELRVRHHRLVDNATIVALPAIDKVRASRSELEQDGWNIRSARLTGAELQALDERQDAQIVALLASWTLKVPLPDMDTVRDLNPDVYDALLAGVREIGPDVFARPSFDPKPDGVPTLPSEPFDGHERDITVFDSTGASLNGGTSTGTGSSSIAPTTSI